MQPAIYKGTLRHRRFRPVRHEFSYSIFMALLDIDRIPELMRVSPFSSYNRFNWASFCDRDHFGDPCTQLRERVAADASANGIPMPDGPVYLLTNLRYLGYCFNPISLFYCCDARGEVRAVLAEVSSNFGERHNYWLTGADQLTNSLRFEAAKAMHVSPFMAMNLGYRFVFTPPGEKLVAHMDTLENGSSFFDATLTLQRHAWSAGELHSALLQHPCMTAKVITAIHWEAAKLWWKKAPLFPHPTTKGAARS